MGRSKHCETVVWRQHHRAELTAGNRSWRRWSQWPGIDSTNVPSPLYRSRLRARTCWSASDDDGALLELGSIALDPAPYRGVVGGQAALRQQFFHISQRKRIA